MNQRSLPVQRTYHHWHSPVLRRDMELLVFGHAGTPVLVFPTSLGRFFEYEERGMVAAVSDVIDRGDIQLFCVDGVDAESWYNETATPRERVARHDQFERYLLDEAVPFVRSTSASDALIVAGASFGGYHAVNFTLRHPELVDTCISMSGTYDIRPLIPGYAGQDGYYHNPMEYLPLLADERYLGQYRTKVRFILAAGEWDHCLDANLQLSRLLDSKGVHHQLDIWGDHTRHDWPWWQMMFKKFLS